MTLTAIPIYVSLILIFISKYFKKSTKQNNMKKQESLDEENKMVNEEKIENGMWFGMIVLVRYYYNTQEKKHFHDKGCDKIIYKDWLKNIQGKKMF